jgi:hypothetical protein
VALSLKRSAKVRAFYETTK